MDKADRSSDDGPVTPKIDFFVSYTAENEDWAEWIAWQLEEAGWTTFLQKWDILPGDVFVIRMHMATEAETTVAVLSPAYQESRFCAEEWAAALALDDGKGRRKLVPIRVADFKPAGLFAARVYIDFVGQDRTQIFDRLLKGVGSRPSSGHSSPAHSRPDRLKPTHEPRFPGSVAPVAGRRPPVTG